MANFQQTVNLTHNSVTKTIIGKDDTGNVGPITGLGLYGQSVPAGGPTQTLNSSTGVATFSAGTGYGTSVFTYHALNAIGAIIAIDVTVIDPTPITATHLELS